MFKRKKKQNNKRNIPTKIPKHGVMGGFLGDKDQRTKAGRRNLISLMISFILIIGGGLFWGFQHHQYREFLINNTTPDNTNLQFAQSGTTLQLSDVWTDKARDLLVVRLKYSNTAHTVLSSDGRRYKIYFATTGKKPANLKLRYGLLGTDGSGFLFIRGDFKHQAYQIFLTNKLALSQDAVDSDNDSNDTDDASSSGTITAALNNTDLDDDTNNKGILSFGNDKKTSSATEDYINFRVNPYSDTTHVSNSSFLTSSGDINYSKVVSSMATKDMTKKIQKDINTHKAQVKTLKATIRDYQQRLAENKNDDIAGSGLSTAKTSLKTETQKVNEKQQELAKYTNADFNRDSFGHMQTKYTLLLK